MAQGFRGLTDGEIAMAQTVFPDPLPYGRVKLREGAGGNAAAAIAFATGSWAITLVDKIYFGSRYSDDFSQADSERTELFLHEMTHVWQYATLGVPRFFGRYGWNLITVGFRPRRAYHYGAGERFREARLEAQADMVGHYARARADRDAPRMRVLEQVHLRESGMYGL